MLLVFAVLLLIVAVAGGVIVHPLLFALALIAIALFFSGRRGALREGRQTRGPGARATGDGGDVPGRHAAAQLIAAARRW
jgi:hypothetical protein